MSTFQRFDRAARLSRVDATPQGGLRADANLTRTGVLTYTRADGSTVRELRHPDDVFDPASLATLKGAPLTIGHPAGRVTPATYKRDSVGHVGDDVRQDGRFVAATVRIQDAAAVESVKAGDLVELSCGYTARVVPDSGEYNGEKYDAVQKDISYNHVAALPKNAGRAGNDVALKLDSGDAFESREGTVYAGSSTEHDDGEDPLEAARAAMWGRFDLPKADEREDADEDPLVAAERAMHQRRPFGDARARDDGRRAPVNAARVEVSDRSEDDGEDPLVAAERAMHQRRPFGG